MKKAKDALPNPYGGRKFGLPQGLLVFGPHCVEMDDTMGAIPFETIVQQPNYYHYQEAKQLLEDLK